MKINKRTIMVVAICLVLIIAAAACYFIFKDNDNENEFEKYYHMKTEAFAVNNLNASHGQIVFIGDSITDLCPLDDYYSELPLAAYNRGIGGDTTSGVLKRLDISVIDIRPSKVVILIGANDINGGVSEKDILENHKKILNEITEKLPETEIYLMSLIPQNKDIEVYANIDVTKNNLTILSINENLKQISKEYEKVMYVDLFSALKDENHFLKKEYSDDGIP